MSPPPAPSDNQRAGLWPAVGWSAAASGLIGAVLSLAWLGTPGPTPQTPPTAVHAEAAPEAQAQVIEPPESPREAIAPVPPPIAEPPSPPVVASVAIRPPPIDAPAWRRHAAPVPRGSDGAARIAIVIDDLGPNRRGTLDAIALPGPLTMAFLPYASDLPRLVDRARQAGHEVIVHLPMEPTNGQVDPGPNALLVELPADELRRRIAVNLDRFGSYVGVNNHMGSRFTADRPAMAMLVEEVARRGLLLIDSRTTSRSVAGDLAREYGVPFAARDVFLDNEASAEAVDGMLAMTERTAKRKGQVIAIGHPHAGTLAALTAWLATVEARGFQLVPVSRLVRTPAGTN